MRAHPRFNRCGGRFLGAVALRAMAARERAPMDDDAPRAESGSAAIRAGDARHVPNNDAPDRPADFKIGAHGFPPFRVPFEIRTWRNQTPPRRVSRQCTRSGEEEEPAARAAGRD